MLSMFAITEGEAITINEGKRSAGSRGRGIGIRVCVGKNEYPLMKEVKKERPAKEGRAVFALDSEELRLGNRSGWIWEKRENPAGVWDSGGVGLDDQP